jgi:hypothetical protein
MKPIRMSGMATCFFAIAMATRVYAQDSTPATIEVRGLISMSAFTQNGRFGFGNGQSASWATAGSGVSQNLLGADVRNTRIGIALPGTNLDGNVTIGGLVELDFFGGFNGTSAFSDEQALLRLRHAYVDVTRGRTSIRLGQAFAPLLGYTPASVTHVAFPLGFASAGVIGWRQPGIIVSRELMTPQAQRRMRVQVAAFRGSWAGPDALDHASAGETSGFPQLEARVDIERAHWSTYGVVHVDQKRIADAAGATRELTGTAYEVGARVRRGPATVQGNGYVGRAIGQQMGQSAQFGDIGSRGGWLQAGWQLSDRLGLWGFAGVEDPYDTDILRELPEPARLRNDSRAVMLKYSVRSLAIGLEWLHSATRWSGEPGRQTASQFALGFSHAFSAKFGAETIVTN